MAIAVLTRVSQPCNDGLLRLRHNDHMSKKDRQRWYLREWRKYRGYTQERLADMVGLSKPYISQLEGGKRQYTQELLEALAEALRCQPVDLIIRDPSSPDGIWNIWEGLGPVQRRQVTEIAETLKKTD